MDERRATAEGDGVTLAGGPDRPEREGRQHDAADQPRTERLTVDEMLLLRDALDRVPVLHQPLRRRKLLSHLPELDSSQPGADLGAYDILHACLQDERGLDRLVKVLNLVGGPTPEWRAFADLVAGFAPVAGLSGTRMGELRAVLHTVSPDVHQKAVGEPRFAEHTAAVQGAQDVAEAFARLEGLAGNAGARARLTYLELVAHQLGPALANALHERIDESIDATPELRAYVEDLCATLTGGRGREAEKSESHQSTGTVRAVDGEGVITLTVGASDSTAQVAPATVWGGVPPRNRNFTGRGALLDEVLASLERHDEATLVPQALYGFGGVGKTQLAIEFAYRFQEKYQVVWWIPSDDERAIRRSLVSLARRLNLPQSDDAEDTIGSVLDALRRGEPHAKWLLIFDNAGDPEQLQRYRPVGGSGHVLITSRSSRWSGQTRVVQVDVFAPEESRALLAKRWPDLDDEQALALAERLGHLPLALEQAAAVHEQTGMTIEEYRSALDEAPQDVLDEGTPTGYPTSVAATFTIAYRELRAKSEAAAQLLALCALMSSQPIAVDILIRGRAAPALPQPLAGELRKDINRRKAIREMGDHALAQLDLGRNLIRIHNLVRDLLREALSDDERRTLEQAAHAVLGLANPGDPDNPANWPALADINPHAVPSGIVFSPDPEARTAFLDQIRYLYAIGDYAESRALGEMAVDNWTANLGRDDENTLVANRHLANSLRELGEYQRMRRINTETLERMRRVLGDRHEHTLATANSAAADLRLLGEFARARDLDVENLALYREVLGEDDLSTQRAANNLAVDHRLLGHFAEAREIDEANVARRASLFGEDHPRTLSSYVGLVRDYLGLGEYNRAFSLQMQKLRAHEERLPAHHAELLRAQRNVAVLYRKTGNYGAALEKARETFEIYRTRFGEKHEQTFAAMLTLCNTLRVTADLDQAAKYGEMAREFYLATFGADHPFALAARADLAIVFRLQGRLDDALAENDKALDGLRTKLDDEHPWVLCAMANRSNILADQGQAAEARELSERVLDESRRIRGSDHPNTLACAANYALDLEATGDNEAEAAALRRDTLRRLRDTLGEKHPETINVGLLLRVDCDIEPPPM